MAVRRLIIIIGSIFFSLTFLNAVTLEINKSAGNIPGSLVPGVSDSGSNNGGSTGGLVSSLYDPTADTNPFTFNQFGYTGVSANCTDYKCTVAEINGERWMVQYTNNDDPSYNSIQVYKENSDDSITLYPSYEGGTMIDQSRADAEQLQQFVDESITLFNQN